MKKFRHAITKEIITLEELAKNLDYQDYLYENFNDNALFEDWLVCENYTLLDIWELTELKKIQIKQQYFEYCKELTATDLDYEEIFLD